MQKALQNALVYDLTANDTKEGIFFTAWALLHAIEVNPGGINGPIQLAVLTNGSTGPNARILDNSEIEEHRTSVTAAEEHLMAYGRKVAGDDANGAPPIPSVA